METQRPKYPREGALHGAGELVWKEKERKEKKKKIEAPAAGMGIQASIPAGNYLELTPGSS